MRLAVLLIEDSPGDVRLTQKAFRAANRSVYLHVATDGAEAMAFLRREGAHARVPRPSLILLDLNLAKMDGRQVLALIKEDNGLATIPTVILPTSGTEEDIATIYQLKGNCYLSKPVQLDEFETLVKTSDTRCPIFVAVPDVDTRGRALIACRSGVRGASRAAMCRR